MTEEVRIWEESMRPCKGKKNLGTQMYKLHEYYLIFCAQHQSKQYLGVQVRDHHYFRGDDVIWVQFSEVH
jgi:hypothetical protein